VSIACIPALRRDTGDVFLMPLLNFGRLLLFQGYLNRREFYSSSMSKYELFDSTDRWRMYL